MTDNINNDPNISSLQQQASLAEKEHRWQDAVDIYNKMISIMSKNLELHETTEDINKQKLRLIQQQRDACSFHSFILLAQEEFAPGVFSEIIRRNSGENRTNNNNNNSKL